MTPTEASRRALLRHFDETRRDLPWRTVRRSYRVLVSEFMLLDPKRPGDFNEALMELGANVCTPRLPRCGVCPVADCCRALAAGTVAERPASQLKRPVRHVVCAVAVDGHGRTLVVRRPENGLLAGMWEFPSAEWETAGGARSRRR